jgi:hypothetical protein
MTIDVVKFVSGEGMKIDIFAKMVSGEPSARMKIEPLNSNSSETYLVLGYVTPGSGRIDIAFTIECPNYHAKDALLVYLRGSRTLQLLAV